MKSIKRQLTFVGLLACLLVTWSVHDDQDVVTVQRRTAIQVTRLYTGPDGQTHAEEIDVKLMPSSRVPGGELSERVDVTGLDFQRLSPILSNNPRNAPQREYVVIPPAAIARRAVGCVNPT